MKEKERWRLSSSMKSVAKGVLKEHLILTPMKCIKKAAERCHSDFLSSIVASYSWGKRVALGTGASFEITWTDDQMECSDLYNFLQMVNKYDLQDQRVVPAEDAKEFSQKEGLFFLETSALNATNVEAAFITVLTEIFNVVNKKSLTGGEEQANENPVSLTGKKILIPGPAQEIPARRNVCCRS
ncbi:unnamed protein product [Victoria cruziana]